MAEPETAALVETVDLDLLRGMHGEPERAAALIDALAQRLADAERRATDEQALADKALESVDRWQARATRAEAALRYYAEETVWDSPVRDRGAIARAALTPTEEPEHG